MSKFSFSLLPSVDIKESINLAVTCEKNNFEAIWVADEIWYRDPWPIMAICSTSTRKIRIGPGVTHIFLRNPAFVAQSLATLDEISNGRSICGLSIGNEIMLQQFKVSSKNRINILREAVLVIKSLLSGQVLDFNGTQFQYKGVSINTKTVQKKIPLYLAGKVGPKAFELAGEVGNGAILSDVYTQDWARKIVKILRNSYNNAKRKDFNKNFDIATWILMGIHENEEIARKLVKPLVTFYLPMQFPKQLENLGVPLEIYHNVSDLLKNGKIKEAMEIVDDDIINKLSITGTPSQISERLYKLDKEGIRHFVVAPADNPTLINLGLKDYVVNDALDLSSSLKLINKKIISNF